MKLIIGSLEPFGWSQRYVVSEEDGNLIYNACSKDECEGHTDVTRRFKIVDQVGGGDVYVDSINGVLRFHDYSTTYGPVPREVLETFSPEIIRAYKKFAPGVSRISIERIPSSVKPSPSWSSKWDSIFEKLSGRK